MIEEITFYRCTECGHISQVEILRCPKCLKGPTSYTYPNRTDGKLPKLTNVEYPKTISTIHTS